MKPGGIRPPDCQTYELLAIENRRDVSRTAAYTQQKPNSQKSAPLITAAQVGAVGSVLI